MILKYILGIDGGGSKTHCLLCTTEGKEIDFLEWGTCNHEALPEGFLSLEKELKNLINSLLERNNILITDIAAAVLGLAGVDTRWQHEQVVKILARLGLKNYSVYNDAFLGIKAGIEKGYGICSVNGTGCTTAGIDQKGRMIQIGGQGILTGDFGGGFLLGAAAVAAVYEYLFKGGSKTVMKDLIFAKLNIKSKYEFMNTVLLMEESGRFRLKELNRVVYEAAALGDGVANNLLRKMGKEIAKTINGALREMDFTADKTIEVVLAGSLHVKTDNPVVLEIIKDNVSRANPNKIILFKKLERYPVLGAVRWALDKLGIKNSYNIITKQKF